MVDLAPSLLASVLMVAAGVGKKRLVWKRTRCAVCKHPRGFCTCRWR
jgi:hypothetical protein